MRIDVLTLFPGMFLPFLDESILGRARRRGLLEVQVHDLRHWAEEDRHRSVDDRPYGGGPGMVLMPGPVTRAVEAVQGACPRPGRLILLTPQGRRLDQALLAGLAREERLVLVAGHYEGFDERVRLALAPEEVSVGDYVLTGGELPALVLIDGTARLLPGVLGDGTSAACESFGEGLLEYPQYTRPAEFRGMRVPEVLLSGDHGAIARWRSEQSLRRTRERRPDLLAGSGPQGQGAQGVQGTEE
ncbi:MAG: tRNA (guanosine(37)-N1)-methyltransferase TrmD [Planctomycetes bacterium]|nr:tRNA (guanosine(37)-N1)-methyltransferase TrmD [Planctomycetota bacterium]